MSTNKAMDKKSTHNKIKSTIGIISAGRVSASNRQVDAIVGHHKAFFESVQKSL
jgi:hypothetical protein